MRKRKVESARVKVARASDALDRAAMKLLIAKHGPHIAFSEMPGNDVHALQVILAGACSITHDLPCPF